MKNKFRNFKSFLSTSVSTISLLGVGLLLLSCATKPLIPESQKTDTSLRQWTSKVEVFDRKKDRKQTVDMDFLSMGHQKLRIDVNANFAVGLAAIVVDEGQMTYLLPRQKKYYQGSANPQAMMSVLRVPMDVRWVTSVLRDQQIQGTGWTCQNDPQGLPQECLNPNQQRSVVWSDRRGDSKKVKVSDPEFEFMFKLNEVPTKVQDVNKAFSLNIPTGYVSVKP